MLWFERQGQSDHEGKLSSSHEFRVVCKGIMSRDIKLKNGIEKGLHVLPSLVTTVEEVDFQDFFATISEINV